MPITNPINNLPRAEGRSLPPSRNPFVVEAIAAAFDAWYEAQGLKTKDHAIPEAGPYRGSMASMRCDRELYYALAGVEQTDPPTIADYWRFFLGQLVHDNLQTILAGAGFDLNAEGAHDLRTIGIPGSSHSDIEIVVTVGEEPVLVEIKSINGFGFKKRTTTFQGPPEGPAYGAVMQAALSAKERGIDKFVVLLVSLENLSPSMASSFSDTEAGRFMAEWHFTVTEMEPQIAAEIERINDVLVAVESDRSDRQDGCTPQDPPARRLRDPEYPDGAVIQRPLKSNAPWVVADGDVVVDSGTYWGCGYCPYFERCRQDP